MTEQSRFDAAAALELVKAFKHELERNKLDDYKPYPKQEKFHAMGANKNERLLSAGNQLGKTYAGAMEFAYHVTGKYPKWWKGRRWDRPIRAWVGGESTTVVRDTSQKLLLGDLTEGEDRLGTGMIPADNIARFTYARGVAQGVDTLVVKHKSGGNSVIKFKSYEQQRIKWQGDTIDLLWCDEEPPSDLYSEGLARFTATGGMAYITFTPLKGMSSVVKRFKHDDDPLRGEVVMTAHDAPHITDDMLRAMLSKYPSHEHECRINGVPMAGEGRIYTVSESLITTTPFDLPDHYHRIIGLDVGHGEHPTAGVWLAHDRDRDILYLYKEYREIGGQIPNHASALRSAGRIPIAWPNDAHQGDKFSGKAVADHYKSENCLMLPTHAQWDDRSISVWPGIVHLQQRMAEGRFKVFSDCTSWLEEYRQYHMQDGKIVKKDDDLLDGTRYAIMSLKYAKPIERGWYPGKRQGHVRQLNNDFNPLG